MPSEDSPEEIPTPAGDAPDDYAGGWLDAEDRAKLARRLYRAGRYADALDEIEQAVEADPFDAPLRVQLGRTLDALDRRSEAADAYAAAVEIDPEDVHALNHLGADLHRLGRVREAIDAFAAIEKVRADFEPSYCNRLLCYADLGDHERAEEMFYLARLYKDVCPACDYHVGRSLAARGLDDKAAFCFRRVLEHSASAADLGVLGPAHLRLAEVHRRNGRVDAAWRHYARGLVHRPDDLPATLDLIDLLIGMGRLGEARGKVRRLLALAPDVPGVHAANGRLLLALRRDAESAAACRAALAIDPTLGGVHVTLARLALRAGDGDLARRHLRDELLLRPESPDLLHELGHLLLDTADPRSAAACFRRIVADRPTDARAWQNLAVAECARGRYDDGADASAEALRLDPSNLAALHNLALARADAGRLDEAAIIVRDGLARDSRDPTLRPSGVPVAGAAPAAGGRAGVAGSVRGTPRYRRSMQTRRNEVNEGGTKALLKRGDRAGNPPSHFVDRGREPRG